MAESHESLFRAREGASAEEQERLAPLEHRAFAREWTKESPVVAPVALTFAIPLYTLAKSLGILTARSPASLREITEGYKGIYEGLKAR
jgi:hypothetical protein